MPIQDFTKPIQNTEIVVKQEVYTDFEGKLTIKEEIQKFIDELDLKLEIDINILKRRLKTIIK